MLRAHTGGENAPSAFRNCRARSRFGWNLCLVCRSSPGQDTDLLRAFCAGAPADGGALAVSRFGADGGFRRSLSASVANALVGVLYDSLMRLVLAAEHSVHVAVDTEADREQDEGQRQRDRNDRPLPRTADNA